MIWKPIKGYEGLYEVNERGQVKSLYREFTNRGGTINHVKERILKPSVNKRCPGTFTYGLTDKRGKTHTHFLHVLVAETFNRYVPFPSLKGEVWKSINSMYQVSNMGRIRSNRRVFDYSNNSYTDWKLLIPGNNGKGYLYVHGDNQNRLGYVHRLVAEAFIENPKGLKEINHKDGDKSNNKSENLEWTDRKGNITHAYKKGLIGSGVKHWDSKLNIDDIQNIFHLSFKGITQREISKEIGVSQNTISDVLRGRYYKNEINDLCQNDDLIRLHIMTRKRMDEIDEGVS
ncbi:NUMOD4 domain-containing protein [Lentilactobacillus kribbianus]|uniref:NUMOD4 domain-containing protein n=1 Tax=Lentilactobacillus kribbianus TaxID=2729622 RepID=UPI001553F4FB|nr:NUMOD4 domain-containing protein [Lentilactobacillus kribbianus]